MTALDPLVAQLAAARKEQGLSRPEVAGRMGFNKYSVMRWENGKHIPTGVGLIAWADALGFTLTLTPKEDS